MAGLLSSWWSGKPTEEKTEDKAKETTDKDDGHENNSDNKDSSWITGLEGKI